MFDINKIDTSKIIIICLVIIVLYLFYQYYIAKEQLQQVTGELKNINTQLTVLQSNQLKHTNNIDYKNINPTMSQQYNLPNSNQVKLINYSNPICNNNMCSIPNTNNIQNTQFNNENIENVQSTNISDKNDQTVAINNGPMIINNNNGESEYSEILTLNGNNYKNVEINHISDDDCDIDDDDDYIFNNGQTIVPHYGTCKDSEIKQKLIELKNDLEDINVETETLKIDTEFVKQNNPILTSFVSGILTKISNLNDKSNCDLIDSQQNDPVDSHSVKVSQNDPVDSHSIEELQNDPVDSHSVKVSQNYPVDNHSIEELQNDSIKEQNNNSIDESDILKKNDIVSNIEIKFGKILDGPNYELNENNILIDMSNPLNVDDVLIPNIEPSSDSELINKELDDKVSDLSVVNDKITLNKIKLTEKYSKLPLDQIKILCSEKKIKLSANKTQKKKKDLIIDLVNHIINSNEISKLP
jgi:hypothetical protein